MHPKSLAVLFAALILCASLSMSAHPQAGESNPVWTVETGFVTEVA